MDTVIAVSHDQIESLPDGLYVLPEASRPDWVDEEGFDLYVRIMDPLKSIPNGWDVNLRGDGKWIVEAWVRGPIFVAGGGDS